MLGSVFYHNLYRKSLFVSKSLLVYDPSLIIFGS